MKEARKFNAPGDAFRGVTWEFYNTYLDAYSAASRRGVDHDRAMVAARAAVEAAEEALWAALELALT